MKNKKNIDKLINNNLKLPVEVTQNYINNFIYKSLNTINKETEVKPNRTYILNEKHNLFHKAEGFIDCIIEILDTEVGTLIDNGDLKLVRNIKKDDISKDIKIYTTIETLTYNNSITMMLVKSINSKNKSVTGDLIFDINISNRLGKDNYNKNIYLN